ncbi:hypothetical protein R6Q59_003518 [Mikania micrantha]
MNPSSLTLKGRPFIYPRQNMTRYNNSMSYIPQLSIPIHFFFFIFVVFVFLCFTWYINYESKVESFMHRFKLILTFTPIVLLVLVRWLSTGERAWDSSSLVLFPEKDSLHRAGGSPWGVAIVLIFLMYMVSHRLYFHEHGFL